MSANDSAGLVPLVSRNEARDAFGKALRLYVGYRGQRRRFTIKQLSQGSGIEPRVIECAMEEADSPDYRNPPLCAVLSLARFLGPEFTCEWLNSAGQGAFWLPEDGETPPGAIAADNAEDNATVTRAAIDGRFDRDEKPVLREVGVRMMARGAHLHAIGSTA